MSPDHRKTLVAFYEAELVKAHEDGRTVHEELARERGGSGVDVTGCPIRPLWHVYWMLGQMKGMVEDSEKFARWLGFVQGVLWMEGLYSIDELREHNRPT
jgi:hypothetical protein